jgi:hypothetical protein
MKNILIRKTLLLIIIIILPALFTSSKLYSKDKPVRLPPQDFIAVFPDFSFHQQYVREHIAYVNYVRDRELSEVHIMMTRYSSGSAGENFVISFIGRNRFEGINNVITYWAPGSNTVDETRRGLVETLKIGLVPYLASTRMRRQISVNINVDNNSEREPLEDSWKNWVFEIYGGGNFFKEESQNRFDVRWGGSADKTTEDWKVRIRPYFNLNERNILTDDGWVTRKSFRHGFNGNVIRSYTDHWSAGIFSSMYSSSFDNIKFSANVSPGVEYSFFPYSEASRKAIKMVYYIGGGYYNYIEMTQYLMNEEFRASQSLNLSIAYQQPWGGFNSSITGSHYFHDFSFNRVTFFSRLDLRVVKGLSLNLNGQFHLIHDLLSLPAGELSYEDILLQQRRQATNYQISGSFGLAYRFGSQYSNVINTRF